MDSSFQDLGDYEAAYSEILAIVVGELPKTSKNTSSVKAKDFSDEAVDLPRKRLLHLGLNISSMLCCSLEQIFT